jgi:holo-[acyl-carrier protein] synthase
VEGHDKANESELSGKGDAFDVDMLEGQLCEISISHDGDFATAVALVPSMRPDTTSPETGETKW